MRRTIIVMDLFVSAACGSGTRADGVGNLGSGIDGGGGTDSGIDGAGGGTACGIDMSCPTAPDGGLLDNAACAVACSAGLICNLDGRCATPSYDVSDAGVVTDLVTGLVWERDTLFQQGPVGPMPCEADAGTPGCNPPSCADLQLSGFDGGWRTPTLQELFSLLQEQPSCASNCQPSVTIDSAAFPSTAPYWYTAGAWGVDFGDGLVFSASGIDYATSNQMWNGSCGVDPISWSGSGFAQVEPGVASGLQLAPLGPRACPPWDATKLQRSDLRVLLDVHPRIPACRFRTVGAGEQDSHKALALRATCMPMPPPAEAFISSGSRSRERRSFAAPSPSTVPCVLAGQPPEQLRGCRIRAFRRDRVRVRGRAPTGGRAVTSQWKAPALRRLACGAKSPRPPRPWRRRSQATR